MVINLSVKYNVYEEKGEGGLFSFFLPPVEWSRVEEREREREREAVPLYVWKWKLKWYVSSAV